MSSLADMFPPGTDLCQLPAGKPPSGETIDFKDPGLKSLAISISVILTTIAVLVGLGRLYANFRKLTLSDLFVLLAILVNIAQAGTIIAYTYGTFLFAGPLDNPSWWDISGRSSLISACSFAKTATLMLFYQLFTISCPMRIAIWVGIAAVFLLYALSICLSSYFAAPHISQTWDELLVEEVGTIVFFLLNLSRKRKIQLMALFFIGFLGVIASLLSLVYRVKSIQGTPDTTYNTRVLMICNLVEMDVALIVCSTTAFAGFMRLHVMESRVFKNLRSTLRGSRSGNSRSNLVATGPNRPRTEREHPPGQKRGLRNMTGYIEMSDTWLLNSGATTNVEGPKHDQKSDVEEIDGLRVLRTVDVEHMPALADPYGHGV
ncbi:Uu.00g009270.m01.CDS01 [Anthostomella pinea]|uniref:Uu.00g009270.m01.CDS01 n=1 Tax=Anthostomella pinea TaxID=933095 RepID=A0AAI8VYK8_9PEZI|nr:Uu.00g009270.m01.CDS01 [Anthostomella pinea]